MVKADDCELGLAMTSEGVQTILSGDTMVKAVNRKPRTFQTPGEKIYSLEEHDTRLRERLLLVNRFEDARLERLQRQITSNERANIGRILRRKDQTRLTLINIACTKRKLQTNVGSFERRLKNGTNSPIFSVELDRVRRREQELSSLRLKLQAPNSQFLAAHVRDELRNIESRLDANPSRLTNSTNPSSVAGSYTHVKLTNDKDTETSLITTGNSEKMTTDNLKELVDEVHTKMSQTNISTPPGKITPVPEVQEINFPVTQPALEQNKMPDDQLKSSFALSAPSVDKPLNLKLEDIPEKPEDIPENKVVSVELPKQELPPLRVTRNKKQKYLSLMQQKLVRTSVNERDQEISHSALKRERHALQRMAELKVKTREDIQGRRTADSDDSLGSIKQQEAVTRLKTSQKSQSQLPSVRREEHEKRTKLRDFSRAQTLRKRPSGKRRVTDSSTAAVGVKLPPLRIDNSILKELKESRLRHRHQSNKLPKLP
ncbi:uncharacterized protein LOC117302076 [Asterias rubens]|uniref:uncharacterized protein LOC117302076 n=1 Tax=Asterias rubens TaxID=7604 RepID=UPI0014556577|nr:uncharacterized protein LOC117302076 [Asterias rubens]XP_033641764.1 uncharacterized protein LOC117302076 [Asterias rubens]